MPGSAAIPLQDPGGAPADSVWRRGIDAARRFLFGHDVFVSYARADALEYAQALADTLRRQRVAAYVDQLGTPPGPKMPPLLLLRLRLSSMLVLVASPGAAASEAVAQEVDEFTRRNHRVFVVDVAGALDGTAWYRERIKGGPARRIAAAELAAGSPSSAVIEHVLKNVDFGRREDRLRRAMWSTLAVIALLLVAGGTGLTVTLGRASAANAAAEAARGRASRDSARAAQMRERADAAARRAEAATGRAAAADAGRAVAESAAHSATLAAAAALDSVEARRRMARALDLANQSAAAWDETSEGLVRSLLLSVTSLHEAWTPDGAAGWLRAMRLLPRRISATAAHGAAVTALAFSEDGRTLASASADREIRLWRVSGGLDTIALAPSSVLAPSSSGGTAVSALRLSRDGRRIAAALRDSVLVWDAGNPSRPVHTLGFRGLARALAISADGQRLAVTVEYDTHLLDLATERDTVLRSVAHRAPSSLAFSPDGRWLATGGHGVELWDLATFRPATGAASGGGSPIRFSRDGTLLVTGDSAWSIERDSSRGVRLSEAAYARTPLYNDVLDLGGGLEYVVVKRFSALSVFARERGEEVSRILQAVTAVLLPNERWVAVGDSTGAIAFVRSAPVNASAIIPDGAASVAFSLNGRWLATGSRDGLARVFSVPAWREVFRAPQGSRVGFSSDAHWLMTADGDVLRLYRSGSWTPRARLGWSLGEESLRDVWLSPDTVWLGVRAERICNHGRPLVSVRVWRVATGTTEAWDRPRCNYGDTISRRLGRMDLVAQAPGWTTLGERNHRDSGGVWSFDVVNERAVLQDQTGRTLVEMAPETYGSHDADLSRDGRWLAVADDDKVQLWRLGPAEPMIAEACARLTRNLTLAEWRKAFAGQPYRRTCPNLPDPPVAPDDST